MDFLQLATYEQMLRDSNARSLLPFGIGIHHAGMVESDRQTIEHLFTERKIQVSR
jgi:replicative superfamily II helicase